METIRSTASSGFELFTEGDELYAAMLGAIDGAEREVRMESFIFVADEVGRRFVSALAARARAGVRVRLHLDQFGAGFPAFRGLQEQLRQAGVAFRWYHPFRWRHPLEYRQRNHRKLLVVDERCAFLGGFNIRRLNSRALSGETRQRDTHVGVPRRPSWPEAPPLSSTPSGATSRCRRPRTSRTTLPGCRVRCSFQATRDAAPGGLPACTPGWSANRPATSL